MASKRRLDLVLYGATGFVGRQTVAYIARHAPSLRWAVAGRSESRLREVLAKVGPKAAADAEVIVADAQDAAALDALAGASSVVLSTAGPFAVFGSELVAACARQRTHYVDITGETPWVRGLIDRHHEQAAADGTRIVPGCGFDSVPSDIGAWMLTRAMLERHREPCADIKASFAMRGGINGGTVASLLNILAEGQGGAVSQPFLLNPAGTVPANAWRHADPDVPHRDGDLQAWLGPFVMGPVNTRVVRRSAALWRARGDTGYGDPFRYQEYMHFGDGPAAALAAAGASSAALAGRGALALAPMRWLLGKVTPPPGDGPSERSMDEGFFRCRLVAHGASGRGMHGVVSDQGDPGNRATTKFVCEAALALVLDGARLPGGKEGGVLTPATALGDVLVGRLRDAGVKLEVEVEG